MQKRLLLGHLKTVLTSLYTSLQERTIETQKLVKLAFILKQKSDRQLTSKLPEIKTNFM